MRLKNIVIAMILSMSVQVYGQQTGRSLNVGDSLPDIVIPKIINSSIRNARTADYKNSLLILDFWGTGCKPCIMALPKMQKLQKQFGSRIKIMPVTSEKEGYVGEFWKHNKYTKNLNLPSVVEDKILSTYFKHRSIPHEVWIYKGKVVGITHAEYVDEYNITQLLDGKVMSLPEKSDFYAYDTTKPLFVFDENQIDINSTRTQYAAISDYKERVNSDGISGGSGVVRNPVQKTVRTYFLNQSFLYSYFTCWLRVMDKVKLIKPSAGFQANEVVWEVADRSKYRYDNALGYMQTWIQKNGICFESLYPDTGQNDQQIYKSVISDLDRLTGLHVRWEKRKEKVLVIKKSNNGNAIVKETSNSTEKYPISSLVSNLNGEEDNPYIFNESGNNQAEISLKIDSWKDLNAVKKGLNVSGFDMVEESREVDKLIFTEVDGSRFIDGQMQAEENARIAAQGDLKPVTEVEIRDFFINNKKQQGVNELPSGLQYKVISQGKGNKPSAKSRVLVHYEGTLLNGKIFDSSYEKGKPSEFTVDELIKGWSQALQIMPEGSKWKIFIPSKLGYGASSDNAKIPANSPLIFTVELIKILP